jgi:hypothetical protein
MQQVEANRARRKWQESCANEGEEDPITIAFFIFWQHPMTARQQAGSSTLCDHQKNHLE